MFLKTQRLCLRSLESEDVSAIYAYRNDPACARYQRWDAVSPDEISRFVEKFRNCCFLSDRPEQHYAICLSSGLLVGDLSIFLNPDDNCITLGITIGPEHQRKGIAREMLSAVVSAIRNLHPQLDIVALIDPENSASIALFEGLGFYRECYAASIRSLVYQIDGRR